MTCAANPRVTSVLEGTDTITNITRFTMTTRRSS